MHVHGILKSAHSAVSQQCNCLQIIAKSTQSQPHKSQHMNPAQRQRVSRKPSKQAGLAPSPVPPTKHKTRSSPKADFLSRFQDKNDHRDNLLLEEIELDDSLDDDFKTLKISDVDKWRHGIRNVTISGLKPNLNQYKENDDDFNEFEDHFEDDFEDNFEDNFEDDFAGDTHSNQNNKIRAQTRTKEGISPATRSTSSPIRRVSLSEYSEHTNETDLTSELNGDDFENVDDIFGDEESGIYTSGGGLKNDIKAKQRLIKQQQQRQAEAQKEEEELAKQWRQREEVQTLRIKDLNPVNLDTDALENERTINYEYTRDDFEDIEEGFELESAVKFEPQSFKRASKLNSKISMPDVRPSAHVAQSKKFKSTMDLNYELRPSATFNSSNRVISKLDRIPSFYSRPRQEPLPTTIEEQNKAQIDDIEMKKQQLLSKYMEFTAKQNKLSSKKSKIQRTERPRNSKLGLVRNLNEVPLATGNDKMKYNPVKKKWEGNNIDLVKFDKIRQKLSRPLLITAKEFKSNNKDKKIHGTMIYDADQMKWINLEDEEDVFGEVSDLVTTDLRDRGVSTFTQRTISTNSAALVPSSTQESTQLEEFFIPSKQIEKFRKEEIKIRRKTTHWFNTNETYKPHKSSRHEDFRWEIRKMVMETD